MQTFDAVVVGLGGVGAAALYELARRGRRVLGIDRFLPGHDRGSSHGQTRIIRQAYFEHPDYVPLVLAAYDRWKALEQQTGQSLYRQTGLLQVGPADGQVIRGVLESARRHQLPVEILPPEQIARQWPGFVVLPSLVGVVEQRAGFLRVEHCVQAQVNQAIAHGAALCVGQAVTRWQRRGGDLVVETDREKFRAGRLILAAGPWAGQLLRDLHLPLQVRRKPVFWFPPQSEVYRVEQGCPAFLYELPEGIFYGLPQHDLSGVKLAEHSGGAVVDDPTEVDRRQHPDDLQRIDRFRATCLPQLGRQPGRHSVCMYTMTPDEHFVVDRHPDDPHIAFAVGLSGHGFKFTCVLGEALADLALEGKTPLPIDFLGLSRPPLRGA